ncbi:MAG: sugar phosphate isomerase/epimerase [Clostridia bacterium]|nr:sugar phosphate isomerase/epimerase [Clostridia bacterium]
MSKFPVALQLYSVRDFMEKDVEATIKKVAEIGYEGVEFAGTFNHTAKELKAICEKYGVKPFSAHVPLADFMNDLENVVAYYKELGCEYVVIPYLPGEYQLPNDFTVLYEPIKKFGECVSANGMTLLYHNHDFEFNKSGDEYMLDLIYSNVPENLLKTQLDTCWVKVGGEDPADYVRKYSGRAPVVHLKDFSGSKSENMYALIGLDDTSETKSKEDAKFQLRPCGYGCQDFAAILSAAHDAGAKWVVVEQDNVSDGMNSLECAKKSFEHIAALNK